jgi:ribosome biogenesis protein SSF1/2
MGRTRRRKRVTHLPAGEDVVDPNATSEEKPPLTFVIGKGKLHQEQRRLVTDFRRAMEPLTGKITRKYSVFFLPPAVLTALCVRVLVSLRAATKLQVRKSNKLQDFVNVAGPLGVTQMIMFTASDLGTYMRVVRRRLSSQLSCPCLLASPVAVRLTNTHLVAAARRCGCRMARH